MRFWKRITAFLVVLGLCMSGALLAQARGSQNAESDGWSELAETEKDDLPKWIDRGKYPSQSMMIGENVKATWDLATRTLTVMGHGKFAKQYRDGAGWDPLKEKLFYKSSEPGYSYRDGYVVVKKIEFVPDAGESIVFPEDSSNLFANFES